MKIKELSINWKVLLALVLIVGVSYLAVNSIFPRSYSGSALNFAIGRGTVTLTNPSGESIPAQLVGESRSFRVSSAIAGLSESPTREGTGTSATYLLEFELPPGETEFSLTRGSNVSFVTTTETRLEATVLPASVSSARTTAAIAVIVVLGALFYISRTTGHSWIQILRHPKTPLTNLTPVAEAAIAGPGPAYRPYGDNRARTGD